MMKNKTKRSYGIWVRGYAPMLLLIIALCVTIYTYIVSSGMPQQLSKNSDQTMQNIVLARTDFISTSMVQRWTEMSAALQNINTLYDELVVANEYTIADVIAQDDLYVDFLNSSMVSAIEVLRRNIVSGVYIVLADQESVLSGKTSSLPGIFLRDRDPASTYNNSNKDLLFVRAPKAVVQSSKISTDSYWMPSFSIGNDEDLSNAFYKPYLAAVNDPTAESADLSYWSTTTKILNDTSESIFYSLPLISSTGEVFGVMGIDISKNLVAEVLPYQELFNGDGAYGIYKTNDKGTLTYLESFSKTGKYTQDFWEGLNLQPTSDFETTTYTLEESYSIQTAKFKLYNTDSPFANENWYLCASVPTNTLYKTTNETIHSVMMLVFWLAFLTIVGIGTMLFQIARPIKHLERQLKSSRFDCDDLNLDPTGIKELDLLASAVEKLNMDVRASAGKFSQILEMSSIGLAAFEFDKRTSHWFISNNFFGVFGEHTQIEKFDLRGTLDKLQAYKMRSIPTTIVDTDNGYECVCEIHHTDGESNFVRIKVDINRDFIRGFVEDVSVEWREIRKLAHERNYDNLTDIFNRRGFYEKYYDLMKLSPDDLKIGALIMLDLDNLKLLNDTYGHDIGDRYIKTTAQVLKAHEDRHTIVSRISGDEFLVFTYGYNSKADCNRFLQALQKNLSLEKIAIGKDNLYPLHISAGVAYYPTDSIERNQLVRFADFAMYRGKHDNKGQFVIFDSAEYEKEEYRIRCKEALNEILKTNAIEMHYQPIVYAKTGKVFAYEALMRPQNDLLNTPLELLHVARNEKRLLDVEIMVNFAAVKGFAHWCENGVISDSECKLFMNTIVNELMPSEYQAEFADTYANYLSRIVLEYTEDERAKAEILAQKREIVAMWGGQIALDDYGSGYNGEAMLLNTEAQYVKLDINMIKNIHNDVNRQQRVTDIINYAHSRGIAIIAEGIEEKDECTTLLELGVDFMQGYYFAKPAFVPIVPDVETLSR